MGRVCIAKFLGSSCAVGEGGVSAAGEGEVVAGLEDDGGGVGAVVCWVRESMGRVVAVLDAAGL